MKLVSIAEVKPILCKDNAFIYYSVVFLRNNIYRREKYWRKIVKLTLLSLLNMTRRYDIFGKYYPAYLWLRLGVTIHIYIIGVLSLYNMYVFARLSVQAFGDVLLE